MALTQIQPNAIDSTQNFVFSSVTIDGIVLSNSNGSLTVTGAESINVSTGFDSGTHSNSAYDAANAASSYANAAFAVANTGGSSTDSYARDSANSASSYANSAYAAANNATDTWVRDSANAASSYANSAYTQANTANTNAATADQKAVTSGLYANSAYSQANTATTNSSTADQKAVTSGDYANSAYGVANTADQKAVSAGVYANASYDAANTTDQKAVTSGLYANSAYGVANTADEKSMSAGLYANSAYTQANTANTNAATADQRAVTSGSYANSAYSQANTATTNAATADQKAVTSGDYANSSYGAANTATTNAATADQRAVTSGSYANSAYTHSNTRFSSSGGTISGNVTIQYDLSVLGNVSFVGNVTSLQVTGNSGQFFGYSANGHNALYAGIPVGYDFQPFTVFQASANYDGYSQINIQNINGGTSASGDYVATADNGTEDDTYVDLGIASSIHSDPEFTLVGPNDGYLYVSGNTVTGGGDLVIGTFLPQNDVVIAAGGMNEDNEQMRIIGSSNTVSIRANVDTSISKNVLLGPIANVHITGGSNDDYIRTDGAGNLSFASLTSASVIGVLYTKTNSAFDQANTADQRAVTSGTYANSGYSVANTADQKAVSAGSYANSAYSQSNTSVTNSVIAGSYANSAYATANNVTAASSYANGAFAAANTADQEATTSGNYANSAFAAANTADQEATTSGNYANSAFAVANTSLNTASGGTVTGNVTLRAANALRVEAASTQDAVVISPRAGGTSSFSANLTTTTLTATRTVTIPDESLTVGFRNIPASGTKTSSYQLTTSDVGKYVQVGTGGSIVIPNATFAEGDAINIFNNTSGSITITCSITTAYIAGFNVDVPSVTLATRGMATILFISSTVCVIAGNVT